MSNIYVVTAHRYGSAESHNYVVGVFHSEDIAEIHAHAEVEMRSGKYDCLVHAAVGDIFVARPCVLYTYRGCGFYDRVEGNQLEREDCSIWRQIKWNIACKVSAWWWLVQEWFRFRRKDRWRLPL